MSVEPGLSLLISNHRINKRSESPFKIVLCEGNNLQDRKKRSRCFLSSGDERNKDLAVLHCDDNSIELCLKNTSRRYLSAAVGCGLVAALSGRSGFVVHGAFLVRGEKGFVFMGPSGSGKSTLSKNATLFNCIHDDVVAVRRIGNTWFGCGVPMFDNALMPGKNKTAPLQGVYFINQGKRFWQSRINQREAISGLVMQTFNPFIGVEMASRILRSVMTFCDDVYAYELCFSLYDDVSRHLGREIVSC